MSEMKKSQQKIESNDQSALNAHLAEIADGRAVVVSPEMKQPTYGEGVKLISQTDQAALNGNLADIASGKAVVVE